MQKSYLLHFFVFPQKVLNHNPKTGELNCGFCVCLQLCSICSKQSLFCKHMALCAVNCEMKAGTYWEWGWHWKGLKKFIFKSSILVKKKKKSEMLTCKLAVNACCSKHKVKCWISLCFTLYLCDSWCSRLSCVSSPMNCRVTLSIRACKSLYSLYSRLKSCL